MHRKLNEQKNLNDKINEKMSYNNWCMQYSLIERLMHWNALQFREYRCLEPEWLQIDTFYSKVSKWVTIQKWLNRN